MKQRSVAVLVGIASIVAFFAASSSALGAVVVNPTTVTGTAGATALIDSTAGRTLNCTSARLTATFPGGGATGSIGNQTFNSCTDAGTGLGLTFTSGGNWTATVSALLSGSNPSQITGVLTLISVPAGTARFSGSGCTFDIVGTQASLTTVAATTPPALVSVSTIPVPGTGTLGTALNLRLANVGILCGILGISNGDAARFTGTYALSGPISGTLR